MTDATYTGGNSYLATRSEDSQGTQTNYGTYDTAGTNDIMTLVTNWNPTRSNNMIRVFTLGGARSWKQMVPGKYNLSGSFEYDVQNGMLMKYAFGAFTTGTSVTQDLDGSAITGGTTGLKRYAITEKDTLDSFTSNLYNISAEGNYDVLTRFYGMKINRLTVRGDSDNPLHANVDWIGQRDDIQTDTGDYDSTVAALTGYSDAIHGMFYNGRVIAGSTVGSNGAITGGTDLLSCDSIEAVLVNNLDPRHTIRNANPPGRGPNYAFEKRREYNLNLDMAFVNTNQLRRFYAGTTTATEPITSTAYTNFTVVMDYRTALTAGTDFKQIRFIFENCGYDETSIPVTPEDLITQTIRAYAKNAACYYISAETQINP